MQRKFWLVQFNGHGGEILFDEDVTSDYEDEDAVVMPCENPTAIQLANWMDDQAQDAKCRPQNEVHMEFYNFLLGLGIDNDTVTRIFQEWAETHDFFHKKGWKY